MKKLTRTVAVLGLAGILLACQGETTPQGPPGLYDDLPGDFRIPENPYGRLLAMADTGAASDPMVHAWDPVRWSWDSLGAAPGAGHLLQDKGGGLLLLRGEGGRLVSYRRLASGAERSHCAQPALR